ncbi:MAG TPA: hypothetical protein VL243_15915 [Vicinamibacterales bacterium]|nr:hypothetical protein [Vicinamibacterales bacterium]
MLRIAGICICLLAAADANAQTPSPDLAAAAEKQAEVRITDDAGREFEGRLLRADDKIFTVTTPDGDIPFSFERISTIYRRGDSLRNGLIIGLTVGSEVGVLASLGNTTCAVGTYEPCMMTSRASIIGGSIATWTALSVGIDALKRGWTRIYPPRRPRSAPTPVQP